MFGDQAVATNPMVISARHGDAGTNTSWSAGARVAYVVRRRRCPPHRCASYGVLTWLFSGPYEHASMFETAADTCPA
jgi:hypothetical protein